MTKEKEQQLGFRSHQGLQLYRIRQQRQNPIRCMGLDSQHIQYQMRLEIRSVKRLSVYLTWPNLIIL